LNSTYGEEKAAYEGEGRQRLLLRENERERDELESRPPVGHGRHCAADDGPERRPEQRARVVDAQLGAALVRVVHVGQRAGAESENGRRAERLQDAHAEEDRHRLRLGADDRADDVDDCAIEIESGEEEARGRGEGTKGRGSSSQR